MLITMYQAHYQYFRMSVNHVMHSALANSFRESNTRSINLILILIIPVPCNNGDMGSVAPGQKKNIYSPNSSGWFT